MKYFSRFMSGAQKTSAGYLIVSGMNGSILEVTKKHETVWMSPSASSMFLGESGELATKLFKVRQYSEEGFRNWKNP